MEKVKVGLKTVQVLDIFFKEVTMKKVLLVLALLAMVSPAFGAATLGLWFSTSGTVPGTPGAVDYSATPVGNMVTLYLWGDNISTAPLTEILPGQPGNEEGEESIFIDEAVVVSIGLDFNFTGIVNPTFTPANVRFDSSTGPLVWDVWNGSDIGQSILTGRTGVELDNIKYGAVQGLGLDRTNDTRTTSPAGRVVNGAHRLGTLTFLMPAGDSSVHIGTSEFGSAVMNPDYDPNVPGSQAGFPASILFGGGVEEISGDPLAAVHFDTTNEAFGSIIPEPGTMLLLGLGALGIIRRRR